MANPIVQASGQWLAKQLARLIDEANRRRDEISTTNGIIVQADRQAQNDTNAARRAITRAELHKLAVRQGQIAKVFKTFWGNAKSIAEKARTWLAANGMTAPQLSGLGLIQVPGALIALVVGGASIWGVNEWIKNANAPQRKRAEAFLEATKAFVAGRISAEQYAAVNAAAEKAANDQSPKSDPLGLAHMLEAATPIIGLAALVLLAKMLLGRSAPKPKEA